MPRLEVAADGFRFDDRPLRIISGGLHYFRIHLEQWADRLRKARLMGLNTIETYVPWNVHSPRPGEFRLDAGLGLPRLLDLAAAEDLHVPLRPGPVHRRRVGGRWSALLAARRRGHRTAQPRPALLEGGGRLPRCPAAARPSLPLHPWRPDSRRATGERIRCVRRRLRLPGGTGGAAAPAGSRRTPHRHPHCRTAAATPQPRSSGYTAGSCSTAASARDNESLPIRSEASDPPSHDRCAQGAEWRPRKRPNRTGEVAGRLRERWADPQLVDFGASDEALLDVASGRARAVGRLPYELPRSMAAVEASRSDVPHDTADPVSPFGADLGL